MADGRRATLLAILAVLLLAAVRFHGFLAGGTVDFRDSGFFFVPWRVEAARIVAEGAFPFWNDGTASGRALAANPNGAVFWPLSPVVLVGGTTALALVDAALMLILVVMSARLLGLSAPASAVAGVVVLFSGVFQTLAVLFTTMATLAPLPAAIALVASLDVEAEVLHLRRCAVAAGLLLGLSLLGGEPMVAAMGWVVAGLVAAGRVAHDLATRETRRARRRTAAAALTFALALLVCAVQLLPALGEFARSSREAEMRPEQGALIGSVPPARLATLLEPRLVGDPGAADDLDYWGAGVFEGGNPYFLDIAIGLIPLAFALASLRDLRGRWALAVAAFCAVASMGRHLPGYDAVAEVLRIFRYPEKWWGLATVALALAAAVGVERTLVRREPEARLLLARVATGLGLFTGALAALAGAAPTFRKLLWAAGLGAGEASAERVAATLAPLLLADAAALFVVGALFRKSSARFGARLALPATCALFLLDATRRVSGSLPVGPPDRWRIEPPAVRYVRSLTGPGRFYDDRADDRAVVVRRALENGGFDPLHPATGLAWGLRYAGDNDVDRMTPKERVAESRRLFQLPWGEEKIERLRRLGVRAVRTPSEGPDPPGVRHVGRLGGDRLVVLEGARGEVELQPGGRILFHRRRPNRDELRVEVPSAARLVLTRSFDPNWRAELDGQPARTEPSDGHLTAITVPAGEHDVVLRYRNPLFLWGGAATAAGLLVAVLAWRRRPS